MELTPFPIRYETLNELYAAVDQSCCLNAVSVPLDEDLTRSFFLAVQTGINNGNPFRCQAITLNGTVIGKIELTRHDEKAAELDLILRKEYTHQGYGSAAVKLLQEQVQQDHWCTMIEAYVHCKNEAMKQVLQNGHFVKGRSFQADVVTPVNGSYTIRTVTGEEYTWSAAGE